MTKMFALKVDSYRVLLSYSFQERDRFDWFDMLLPKATSFVKGNFLLESFTWSLSRSSKIEIRRTCVCVKDTLPPFFAQKS